MLLHARVIALHDVDLALVLERQAERQRDALDGREVAVQRAEALGVAGNVVEQDRRRRVVALLGQHLGDAAHLGVPVRVVDVKQLAHALHLVEPAAQAVAVPAAGLGFAVEQGHGAVSRMRGNDDFIRKARTLSINAEGERAAPKVRMTAAHYAICGEAFSEIVWFGAAK